MFLVRQKLPFLFDKLVKSVPQMNTRSGVNAMELMFERNSFAALHGIHTPTTISLPLVLNYINYLH